MKLKEIHPDIDRYLECDCYCPGEIYDASGFFFQVFNADEECEELYRGTDFRNPDETIITVICRNQIINFWEREDKITDAERYDATENNIRIMPFAISGTLSPKDRLDEFKPGETAKNLKDLLNLADAVMS